MRELRPGPWLRAARAGVLQQLREDRRVTLLVAVFCVWQLAAALWDLPCMYGWENDGVAPRDLFGGLAANLKPGSGHRYPLFHYLLLAVLCLPALLAGLATAPGLTFPALAERMLSVPVLTAIDLSAKLLSIAMGAVTVLTLARIARRLFGASAGLWSAGFAVTNLSLAYYARAVNLDGPYLMWGVLAADRLLDVLEHGRRSDYLGLALCAALSVATKDQAYSLYALSLPLYLLLAPLAGAALPAGRAHWRELAQAAAAGALWLGVCGGGLLNPSGFVQRLHLLAGPNSQDWRQYEASLPGVLANLRDLAAASPSFFWPWPALLLALAGSALALLPAGASTRRARLVPLSFALSSLLTFTLVTARCEHRFVLPLGGFAACYAGLGAAALVRWASRLRFGERAAQLSLGALLAWSGAQSLALQLTQWGDARREVEHWLLRLPAGSTVETYGLGVYLPRFDRSVDAPYRVQRVGPGPRKRPPIPGIAELYDAYGRVDARAPDVLVIPEGFASRFTERELADGRAASNELARYQSDADAMAFFARARSDRLPGYRLALEARPRLPGWAAQLGLAPVSIHGSTAQRAWILTRATAPGVQSRATAP